MNKALSLDSIYARSKNIVPFKISDKVILVPLKGGVVDFESQLCALSETGWAVLKELDGVRTLRQAAKALAEKFASTEKEIEKDVLGFISVMIGYDLCTAELTNQRELKDIDTKDPDLHKADLVCDHQLLEKGPSSFLKFVDLPDSDQTELLFKLKNRALSFRTSIRGSSMAPFICNQDIVTVKFKNDTPLRVGEVLVFKHWQDKNLVIHRIITKGNSGWVTKGDNCIEPDGDVPEDSIIGFVKHVERNGKKVRICLGPERKIIALLNRGKGLFFLRKFFCKTCSAFGGFFEE